MSLEFTRRPSSFLVFCLYKLFPLFFSFPFQRQRQTKTGSSHPLAHSQNASRGWDQGATAWGRHQVPGAPRPLRVRTTAPQGTHHRKPNSEAEPGLEPRYSKGECWCLTAERKHSLPRIPRKGAVSLGPRHGQGPYRRSGQGFRLQPLPLSPADMPRKNWDGKGWLQAAPSQPLQASSERSVSLSKHRQPPFTSLAILAPPTPHAHL